jgi:hypothetical protein
MAELHSIWPLVIIAICLSLTIERAARQIVAAVERNTQKTVETLMYLDAEATRQIAGAAFRGSKEIVETLERLSRTGER